MAAEHDILKNAGWKKNKTPGPHGSTVFRHPTLSTHRIAVSQDFGNGRTWSHHLTGTSSGSIKTGAGYNSLSSHLQRYKSGQDDAILGTKAGRAGGHAGRGLQPTYGV